MIATRCRPVLGPPLPVRLAGDAATAATSRPASTEPAPSVANATAPLTTSRRVRNAARSLTTGKRTLLATDAPRCRQRRGRTGDARRRLAPGEIGRAPV